VCPPGLLVCAQSKVTCVHKALELFMFCLSSLQELHVCTQLLLSAGCSRRHLFTPCHSHVSNAAGLLSRDWAGQPQVSLCCAHSSAEASTIHAQQSAAQRMDCRDCSQQAPHAGVGCDQLPDKCNSWSPVSDGVCGGPLAFVEHTNLMSYAAFHQALACVEMLYQQSQLMRTCIVKVGSKLVVQHMP
jgi:hypothetical protein